MLTGVHFWARAADDSSSDSSTSSSSDSEDGGNKPAYVLEIDDDQVIHHCCAGGNVRVSSETSLHRQSRVSGHHCLSLSRHCLLGNRRLVSKRRLELTRCHSVRHHCSVITVCWIIMVHHSIIHSPCASCMCWSHFCTARPLYIMVPFLYLTCHMRGARAG